MNQSMQYQGQPLAPAQASQPNVKPDFAATRIEEIILLVLLIIFCCLPYLLHDQPKSDISIKEMGITSPQGNAVQQVIMIGMYGIIGIALLQRLGARARTALSFPLVALLLWMFASAIWSDISAVTLRRCVALTGTLMLGYYLALCMPPQRLTKLLCQLALIVLSASICVALLQPQHGLDQEGRLRGVFAHKNTLASFAALGIVCAVAGIFNAKEALQSTRMYWWAGALCILALILSRSATPVSGVLTAAILIRHLHRQPANSSHWGTAVICVLLAMWMLVLPLEAGNLGEIAKAFGRTTNFSGRSLVWDFSLAFIERRPLTGYGYTAFWSGPAALLFVHWGGFPVPHSHNGAMQLLLDCGLIGLSFYLWLLWQIVTRLHHGLNTAGRPQLAWVAGFLALYLFTNSAESHLMEPNDLYAALLAYCAFWLNLQRVSAPLPKAPTAVPGNDDNDTLRKQNLSDSVPKP